MYFHFECSMYVFMGGEGGKMTDRHIFFGHVRTNKEFILSGLNSELINKT